MTTASGDDDAFDRRFANQARLAFPAVNAMLDLKKAFVSIRVNIVGDARTAEPNGFFQNSLERLLQPAKIVAS